MRQSTGSDREVLTDCVVGLFKPNASERAEDIVQRRLSRLQKQKGQRP